MTDENRQTLLKMIERFTEEDTRSPEIALAALVREGIYTKDGELAAPFRAPEPEKQRA